MPASNEARKAIMNAAFRGDALTFPTTYWLSLHNTTLSTSTLPTTANEVTTVGTGYNRMPLTTAHFTSATTALSTVHLTTGVQFADPLTNWTTAKGFALWDSSAGGSTVWFYGDLNTSVNISAGNPVRVSSGNTTNGLQIGLS